MGDSPRGNSDFEKTINDVLEDLSVPGRYPIRTAERIRDSANDAVETAKRNNAVHRATQRGH